MYIMIHDSDMYGSYYSIVLIDVMLSLSDVRRVLISQFSDFVIPILLKYI